MLFTCRYITGWFLIDLMTSFPFEFIFGDDVDFGTALKSFRVVRVLRVIKIFRFFKMIRLLNSLLRELLSREFIIVLRLCRFLFVMILFAHFFACGWYYVGIYCLDHPNSVYSESNWIVSAGIEDSSLFVKYSTSLYWSIVTLMTTGYGDITANNVIEQWVASSCILVGTCFFAYFVGAVGTLLADGDRVRTEKNEKIEQAHQFCVSKHLPKDLSHAIMTHTKYHCKNNYLFDEMGVLSNLPVYLRLEVSAFVGKQILRQIELFSHLDSYTIGLIGLKMRQISCNAGHKLFQTNDTGKEIYIQRSGKSMLEFIDDQNESTNFRQVLERGDVCGELAFQYTTRHYSLHCLTWCEFYVIDIQDIWAVLEQEYPRSYQVCLSCVHPCLFFCFFVFFAFV